MSQASSIKLENNKDVKIKQEINLNLAKQNKRKGWSTSEAGVVNIIHAVIAVQKHTQAKTNHVPGWERNVTNARY